jgi:hypothetical protein
MRHSSAGPAALAWSRFDEAARARVRQRYVEAITPWRQGHGYRIPGEFVVVAAVASRAQSALNELLQPGQ